MKVHVILYCISSQMTFLVVCAEQELGSYPPLIRDSVFPPGGQMKGEGGPCGDEGPTDPNLMLGAASSAGGVTAPSQQLKWQAHVITSWHEICDGALQDM